MRQEALGGWHCNPKEDGTLLSMIIISYSNNRDEEKEQTRQNCTGIDKIRFGEGEGGSEEDTGWQIEIENPGGLRHPRDSQLVDNIYDSEVYNILNQT